MKKILVVTSYKLSYEQMKELEQLNYEYIYMNDDLKKKWGDIGKSSNINEICDEILLYAKEKSCAELFVMGFTPAVVYIASKFGLEKCCYSYTKEFLEEVKNIDGTTSEIFIVRHIGFYNYLKNRRIMPYQYV